MTDEKNDKTPAADDAQAAADAAAAAQAAGTDSPGGNGDEDETNSVSPADARKLRSEAKNLRGRLRTLETQLAERDAADLTATQKLERDLSAEKASREQVETQVRNLRVQVAASKLGIRADAVDVVGSMIDWESIDDANDAKQVERAIKDLLKERPFLSARDPEGLGGGKGREADGTNGAGTSLTDLLLQKTGR